MMKKFLIRTLMFCAIVSAIDFVMGIGFDKIVSIYTTTDLGRDNHICNIGEEDILVFGSSRGVHHYDTQMISDSIGIPSYNCSEDGQGIILNYARFCMFQERHIPKMIIYDVEPAYDICQDDPHRYLKWLRFHCNRHGIMDIISSIDKTERYKLVSRLYRYNSKLPLLLTSLKHLNESIHNSGYVPLFGKTTKQKKQLFPSSQPMLIDTLKLHYMESLIQSLHDTKILFVISPSLYRKDRQLFKPIDNLCQKYNIELIDYSNDPKYLQNERFFNDPIHLNHIGADEFTRDIIATLKQKQLL